MTVDTSTGHFYVIDTTRLDRETPDSWLVRVEPLRGMAHLPTYPTGCSLIQALAMSPDGVMFGYDTVRRENPHGMGLVRIDLESGVATDLVEHDEKRDIQAMTFDSDGSLFAIEFCGVVFAGSPNRGHVYLHRLLQIDVGTGAATVIGDIIGYDIRGLASVPSSFICPEYAPRRQ